MGAIQVKGVPGELHEAVRRRAAEEGMTVGDYLLTLVRRDLAIPSRRQWLDRLSHREPVVGVDVLSVLDEVRGSRDAEMSQR